MCEGAHQRSCVPSNTKCDGGAAGGGNVQCLTSNTEDDGGASGSGEPSCVDHLQRKKYQMNRRIFCLFRKKNSVVGDLSMIRNVLIVANCHIANNTLATYMYYNNNNIPLLQQGTCIHLLIIV